MRLRVRVVYAHYIVWSPESEIENPVRLWCGGVFASNESKGIVAMAIEDLITKFEAFTAPGDGITPDIDAVLNGVTEVYNQDISVRDLAVQTYKEKLEEQVKANNTLKQANYDLSLRSTPSTVTPNTTNDPEDQDENERAATIRVADLFTRRK